VVSARRFHRFEHIVSCSSGKVVAKSSSTLSSRLSSPEVFASKQSHRRAHKFCIRPNGGGRTNVGPFWLVVSKKSDYLRILHPVSLTVSVVNPEPMSISAHSSRLWLT